MMKYRLVIAILELSSLLTGSCSFQLLLDLAQRRAIQTSRTNHRHLRERSPNGNDQCATKRSPTCLCSSASSPDSNSNSDSDGAAVQHYREQAERMRLEAQRMEAALTQQKLTAFQSQLRKNVWVEHHPVEAQAMHEQLMALYRTKLQQEPPAEFADMRFINDTKDSDIHNVEDLPSRQDLSVVTPSSTNQQHASTAAKLKDDVSEAPPFSISSVNRSDVSSDRTKDTAKAGTAASSKAWQDDDADRLAQNPICGFADEDLALYLPVAWEIERTMPNASVDAQLTAFREHSTLKAHFERKLQEMVLGPMQEITELERKRQKYMNSISEVEKEQLKRDIKALEDKIEALENVSTTTSLQIDVPPMTGMELRQRVHALKDLPVLLQALYKKRNELPYDARLTEAILLEHYEQPLQLLEQVQFMHDVPVELEDDATRSIGQMPPVVRHHLARKVGLRHGDNIPLLVAKVLDRDNHVASASSSSADGGGKSSAASTEKWVSLQDVGRALSQKGKKDGKMSVVMSGSGGDEYNDLEFLDRSRYIEELYPAVARLEGKHPSRDTMDAFVKLMDRRTYMVTSKPERVLGGYYVRGTNQISDDAFGVKLVQRVQDKLVNSELQDELDVFYIRDPSPMSLEKIELGYEDETMLLVTRKDRAGMLDHAGWWTKLAVSMVGMASIALFALGTVELQPVLQERIDQAIDSSANPDLSWVSPIAAPVAWSVLMIQLTHEFAHQMIALRDGFRIGLPTPIPSLQTGLLGAITPLKSPPPSLKSMFDFAIAGPLFGMLASFVFLVHGLDLTAQMAMSSVDLPAFPQAMLRSSALVGGLVEFFLGRGAITSAISDDAVVSLHPEAIAGYAGAIINALALLPLGCTDGGRVALAMFGRRGTYVVGSFTSLMLCVAGLFGLDDSKVILVYILFALIWQRGLELPARNEVEELDFVRGAIGIASALLVALTLLPMV